MCQMTSLQGNGLDLFGGGGGGGGGGRAGQGYAQEPPEYKKQIKLLARSVLIIMCVWQGIRGGGGGGGEKLDDIAINPGRMGRKTL